MLGAPTTPVSSAPGVLRLDALGAEHGFTTRSGGVSTGPYASLNLGLSSGDDRVAVERNRDLLLAHLGVSRDQVCGFNQVHGDRVLVGRPTWFEEDADAAISDDPDLLLVVSAADCFPVLFHDPASGAVGAAHCGWRGTALGLVAAVVRSMRSRYGSRPDRLRVAIGPGIRGGCYQVSADVADRFRAAGFPESVLVPQWSGRQAGPAPAPTTSTIDSSDPTAPTGQTGPTDPTDHKYLLDLEAAMLLTLAEAGVAAANVGSLRRCTHCEPAVFFSHRRDAGLTGRLWGFVRATAGSGTRR